VLFYIRAISDIKFVVQIHMQKFKTHKSISKRFKITKKGKLMKKKAGQDHFNARESGNITRGKRRAQEAAKAIAKPLKPLIPYSK